MARPPLLPDFDLRHTVLDLKTDLVIPVSPDAAPVQSVNLDDLVEDDAV